MYSCNNNDFFNESKLMTDFLNTIKTLFCIYYYDPQKDEIRVPFICI